MKEGAPQLAKCKHEFALEVSENFRWPLDCRAEEEVNGSQERLAQAAAWYVVQHDFGLVVEESEDGEIAPARMLKYVTLEDTPDSNPDAFDYQIRELYLMVRGVPLAEEATEAEELMALWKQLHSVEASPRKAWAGVLSAVLRDPAIVTY